MKFCGKCGNQLLDEAIMCPKCGCSVGNEQSASERKKTISQTINFIITILGFLFGIGLLLGMFYFT